MSYFNRRAQFLRTLTSIQESNYSNVEVIVVDDGSESKHRLEDIEGIKLIRVEPEDKTYINPCVPFNKGFSKATGDIIILQNPECIHIGDIITHAVENITDNNYIPYGCYSFDESNTNEIPLKVDAKSMQEIVTRINKLPQIQPKTGDCGWYNHNTIIPTSYHYTAAITKRNLDILGGFDERFAHGIGFDDDEFLARVKHLGLKVEIPNNMPIALHQWHYTNGGFEAQANTDWSLFHKNRILFEDVKRGLK